MTRQEWLQWRKQGLGSSDLAVIMGASKWKTLLELYEEKLPESPVEEKTSYVMERGNRAEPKIRSLLSLKYNKNFDPALCVMDGCEFMRVSLDGFTEDKTEIAEFKLLNKADWMKSKYDNILPPQYVAQVQGQLLVSRAKKCYFAAYLYTKEEETVYTLDKLAIVEVLPDLEYQAKLLKECQKFWHENVLKRVPPGMQESDYKPFNVTEPNIVAQWKALDQVYEKTEQILKQIEAKKKTIEDKILGFAEKTGYPRLVCGGIKLTRRSRKGNVVYKNVPQLEGVDLEPYRGKEVVFWQMEREEAK